MLRRLYDWVMRLAHHPHAAWVLAAVSFAESSFFPIPPDAMLIPMVLADRKKAWRYAAIAVFPWNIAIQVTLSLILGTLSCTAWTLFGTSLRPVLRSPRAVRTFNIVMALLLLASLYPVFMDA